MKTLKILTSTVSVAVALAAVNPAFGQSVTQIPVNGPLRLTVSGTATVQDVYNPDTASTTTFNLNEKTVYLLVSNYVANAASYSFTNIVGTNLPANGYIAFDANRDTFYITNDSGFYYPLNGYDASGQYYSWIEFDSIVDHGAGSGYLFFGFIWQQQFQLFSNVTDYQYRPVIYNHPLMVKGEKVAAVTSTSTAVLYIHDDPYNFDDADNPHVYWDNYNPWYGGPWGGSNDEVGHNNSMIEIRGILVSRFNVDTIQQAYVYVTSANFSLSGFGNFYEHDIYDLRGVVTTGQASLVQ